MSTKPANTQAVKFDTHVVRRNMTMKRGGGVINLTSSCSYKLAEYHNFSMKVNGNYLILNISNKWVPLTTVKMVLGEP